MPNLIPLFQQAIGDETKPTVNARDLHAFLGVRQRFNDWISKRIEQYGFLQDIDFTCYYDSSSANQNPAKEYFLSLDMGKQLSMGERTSKGKEARLYFLECERIATVQIPKKALTANEMFLLQAQVNVELEQKLLAQGEQIAALQTSVSALVERQPPAEKLRIEEWLRRHGKPFLPKPVLNSLNALCRDLETPEMFRPDGYDYPVPYFSPSSIAAAYEQTMRPLTCFIRKARQHYRHGRL